MEADLSKLWDNTFTPKSWQEFAPQTFGGASMWGNSFWSTFAQCPKRAQLAYVEGIVPEAPDFALEVGGLYHECRATGYASWLEHKDDKRFEEDTFALVHKVWEGAPGVAAEVNRLLRGWFVVYGQGTGREDHQFSLAVEEEVNIRRQEHRTKLRAGDFPYSCRLDRLVWNEELGGPMIVEIKTTGARYETLLQQYQMNAQFVGQQYAYNQSSLRKRFGKLVAMQVDLAVKGRQASFTRETVPIYDGSTMRKWGDWMRDLWYRYKIVVHDRHWPHAMHNCFQYRLCPYHAYCASRCKDMTGLMRKKVGR